MAVDSFDGLLDQLGKAEQREVAIYEEMKGMEIQFKEASAQRRELTARFYHLIDQYKQQVEQNGLRVDFETGDTSVSRDSSGGNGACSFRRSSRIDGVMPDNLTSWFGAQLNNDK